MAGIQSALSAIIKSSTDEQDLLRKLTEMTSFGGDLGAMAGGGSIGDALAIGQGQQMGRDDLGFSAKRHFDTALAEETEDWRKRGVDFDAPALTDNAYGDRGEYGVHVKGQESTNGSTLDGLPPDDLDLITIIAELRKLLEQQQQQQLQNKWEFVTS